MTSTGGNSSAGYPDPMKGSVLNWGCGKVSAALGNENISLSLPFVLSLSVQLSFSGVFPAQARGGCFYLVCKAEMLAVKNTGSGEENTHSPLHLRCILSPAKP